MTKQEILGRLRHIAIKRYGDKGATNANGVKYKVHDIGIDTVLPGTTGMDSLDHIEYILAVEDDLDVEVTDENIEAAKTFGDLAVLIEKKLVAK